MLFINFPNDKILIKMGGESILIDLKTDKLFINGRLIKKPKKEERIKTIEDNGILTVDNSPNGVKFIWSPYRDIEPTDEYSYSREKWIHKNLMTGKVEERKCRTH